VDNAVNLEDFEKLMRAAHRKTKAFAEYPFGDKDRPRSCYYSSKGRAIAKHTSSENEAYTIEPAHYTTREVRF
jgi:hypothetical protein